LNVYIFIELVFLYKKNKNRFKKFMNEKCSSLRDHVSEQKLEAGRILIEANQFHFGKGANIDTSFL